MRHPILFAVAIAAPFTLSLGAQAQEQSQGGIELPEGCRTSAQAGAADAASGMQGTTGDMNETQKGLRDAMMQMNGPMMQGMMNQDPDLAWICAMIPHHQGAIAMARAGLQGADDAESKRLAEQTIRENERGVRKLIDWVNEHATTENANEGAAAASGAAGEEPSGAAQTGNAGEQQPTAAEAGNAGEEQPEPAATNGNAEQPAAAGGETNAAEPGSAADGTDETGSTPQ